MARLETATGFVTTGVAWFTDVSVMTTSMKGLGAFIKVVVDVPVVEVGGGKAEVEENAPAAAEANPPVVVNAPPLSLGSSTTSC